MSEENYLYLNLSDYAKKKLGAVLKVLEEHWFRELHYLLSVCWKENDCDPPRKSHYACGVLVLSAASGISTTLYNPGGYIRGKSKKHFKGLLMDQYPWDLDQPENASKDRAIEILYDTFRNPMVHALGIQKHDGKLIKYVLPFIDNRQEINRRIVQDILPFGSPTIQERSDAIVFNPASFYWGLRKMVESMLSKYTDVDQIHHGLVKNYGIPTHVIK